MASKKPKGLGRGLEALLGAGADAIDKLGAEPAAAPRPPHAAWGQPC